MLNSLRPAVPGARTRRFFLHVIFVDGVSPVHKNHKKKHSGKIG